MRRKIRNRPYRARKILMDDRVNGGEVFGQKRRKPVHRMGGAGLGLGRSGRRSQKTLSG
jgi:hypothetical protein